MLAILLEVIKIWWSMVGESAEDLHDKDYLLMASRFSGQMRSASESSSLSSDKTTYIHDDRKSSNRENLWIKGFAGEHGPHLARGVEKHVRWFWRYIMCPLLFGLIGTLLNFNGLKTGTVARAIAIIFAGAFPTNKSKLNLMQGFLCPSA